MPRDPIHLTTLLAIPLLLIACGGAERSGSPSSNTPTSNVAPGTTSNGSTTPSSNGSTHNAPTPNVGPNHYCPDAPAPAADRAADGTPLPDDTTAHVLTIWASLGDAMKARDDDAIRGAVCAIRAALGPWQGVAEAPARYAPIDNATIDFDTLTEDYAQGLGAIASREAAWIVNRGSTHGGDVSAPLRAPCNLARWMLAASQLDVRHADDFEAAARDGLDWLIAIQQPDGAFPYPDLTDDAEAWWDDCRSDGNSDADCREAIPRAFELAVMAKRDWEAAGRPEGYLNNGWWVSDDLSDPGGAQFDTSECGRALIDGYRTLGDDRYLDAARRAGAWAAQEDPVPNWNYNAFSVDLMAMLAAHDPTPPQNWTQAALTHAHRGVLPGALPDGRWVDPHNARIVYHMIILRALIRLAHVSPDPWTHAVLDLALQRIRGEFTANGPTALDDGLETYTQATANGLTRDNTVLDLLIDGAVRDGEPAAGGIGYWLLHQRAP